MHFGDDARRHWSNWLILALAIALGERIFVALTHPIDYNGYWHVFIARNLTREYGGLAHPPLFPLLLKAADAIRQSRVSYEAIPVLSGVGSVFLVYLILRKLHTGPSIPLFGAFAMATSTSAILLSCEVQSYMPSVFLILWSFLYYLDLVDAGVSRIPRRSRVAFSALSCLALLTEYFAGLYLLACVLAPLLLAVVRPAYRRSLARSLLRRAGADLATLLPPVILGALLYELIAKPWIRQLNHLPEFYLRPGIETAVAFLMRNLWNLFNLFSPAVLWSPRWAAALVLGFAAFTFLATATEHRRGPGSENRAMPAAVLIVLLVVGMALGLAGKYPFGGVMRQQFLLFQFALLAGFIAFDRLVESVRSAKVRRALTGACALAVAANFAGHVGDLRPGGHEAFASQTRTFEKEFPDARLIQVDQLNLIGFFMPHYDWNWRFAGREPGNPAVERYELQKGEKRLTLVAHRDRWNFDFRAPTIYPSLASALRPGDPACFAVFCVHTNLYKPPERRLPHLDAAEVAAQIEALAPPAGLEPGKVVIRFDDVYAGFCLR